jgi:hypothetical protein
VAQAARVERILDVPKRERDADVKHHRETNDLGRALKSLTGLDFGMTEGYSATCSTSSRVCLTAPPRRRPTSLSDGERQMLPE